MRGGESRRRDRSSSSRLAPCTITTGSSSSAISRSTLSGLATLPPILTTSISASQRVQTAEAETGGFIPAAAHVERLHRLTGRALHQVVNRAGHDETARMRVALEADVAEVGAG